MCNLTPIRLFFVMWDRRSYDLDLDFNNLDIRRVNHIDFVCLALHFGMVWYHENNFLFNFIVPPSLWHLFIVKLPTKCEEWFLYITEKMKNGKNVSLRKYCSLSFYLLFFIFNSIYKFWELKASVCLIKYIEVK